MMERTLPLLMVLVWLWVTVVGIEKATDGHLFTLFAAIAGWLTLGYFGLRCWLTSRSADS